MIFESQTSAKRNKSKTPAIIFTFVGLIVMATFTIRPITFTIEKIKDYHVIPKTSFEMERLFFKDIPPELWLFAGIGAVLLLFGVFSARWFRFWILLVVIGIISILSSSGVFLQTYQVYRLFPTDTFFSSTAIYGVAPFDEILDNIKFLLPGIACIIGGLLLHKRGKSHNTI
jgi:hypothetical protein